MQKTKKGISLIVLVITIIVMIILAATIIITLNNNGIIDKASEAVDKTNEKQVEELVSLAWADAYAENVGKSETELQETLYNAVEKVLNDNNLSDKYTAYVTTTGVEIIEGTGWVQTSDRHVIKENKILEIGDYVNYVSGVESYTDTNGWQVLGAENGELLIMSASDVAEIRLSGATGFEYGIWTLDDICIGYGNGKFATNARSIRAEDIDRVTGYDKTTYRKGTMEEYGNILTYSYDGTKSLTIEGTNGCIEKVSKVTRTSYGWYDMNYEYHEIDDITTNGIGILTVDGVEARTKNTLYTYDADLETDLKEKAPNAYNMLFGSNDEIVYFLANNHVCYTYSIWGNFSFVQLGSVIYETFTQWHQYYGYLDAPVRAVVQLSSDYNP